MEKFLISDVLIDPHSNEATINGRKIRLEPKTTALLSFLVLNAGRTTTKEEIFEHVWPGTIVSEDSITRSVSQIRKLFKNDPDHTIIIETIPKKGYRLNASVRFIERGASNEEIKEKVKKQRYISPLLAGIIAALIALFSVYGVGSIFYGQGIAIILAAFGIVYTIFFYLNKLK